MLLFVMNYIFLKLFRKHFKNYSKIEFNDFRVYSFYTVYDFNRYWFYSIEIFIKPIINIFSVKRFLLFAKEMLFY